eukprot:gene10896-biopygen5265
MCRVQGAVCTAVRRRVTDPPCAPPCDWPCDLFFPWWSSWLVKSKGATVFISNWHDVCGRKAQPVLPPLNNEGIWFSYHNRVL